MKPFTLLAAVLFGLSFSPAIAADASLYSVPGVEVDATAGSAAAARDLALARGRPEAWQRLYRRLTPPSIWDRQPNLDAAQLERMILSLGINNERRSTTRYLAEITYNFNPAEVQNVLRANGVRFAEAQARPVLVVPVTDGGYNPNSEWARAWAQPSITQGLVPVILPNGDAADQPVLGQAGLAGMGWDQLAPLAERYDVEQVVIARTTPDGNSAQIAIVTQDGRQVESLAFAQSTLAATADAAAQLIAGDWKENAAVDYSRRNDLVADVSFNRPQDWHAIRDRLEAVRTVAGVSVLGLSVREARVELTYFGQTEQLGDAMAQQGLEFNPARGGYILRLGNDPVVNR